MNIHRVGKKGTFHLIRRIPTRFDTLDLGTFFKKSLRTDDRAAAEAKAANVWSLALLEWEARLAGRNDEAVTYHTRLTEIAEHMGHAYLPAEMLAEAKLDTIVSRLDSVEIEVPEAVDALLGASNAPSIPLRDLAQEYEQLMSVENAEKSPQQLTRWRTGVERTIDAFRGVVGDINVLSVDPNNAYQYRSALAKRITDSEITAYTGNREMYTLNAAIKRVAKGKFAIDMDPFKGLLFKEKKTKKRARQVAFATEWISDRILAPDAMPGINAECRDIWLMMINTPARPSELVSLNAATIHLDAEVPHISIEPDGRQMKTAAAERLIPLVGRSLDIMAQYPDGFQRYAGNAGSWSALISKHLKACALLPTDQHKAYSLRHSLSDRLLNEGCPDRIKDQLMGHAEDGTPYGDGVWLKTAQDWLTRVAL